MSVKWIGDAAQELGMTPLDAVEILASRQEYPMNGLIDEDRFKTLRLMRASKRLESSGAQAMPVPQRHAPPPPAHVSASAPAPPPAPSPTPASPPPPAAAAPPPPRPAAVVPQPAPPAVVPAPPPSRPPVGEATSVTAPLQTMPDSGGERTVILSPIDPKV